MLLQLARLVSRVSVHRLATLRLTHSVLDKRDAAPTAVRVGLNRRRSHPHTRAGRPAGASGRHRPRDRAVSNDIDDWREPQPPDKTSRKLLVHLRATGLTRYPISFFRPVAKTSPTNRLYGPSYLPT